VNAFYIERPYTSSGLRRTYFKKLEVYYGEIKEIERYNRSYYTWARTISVFVYNNKKGCWIEKPTKKYFSVSIPKNKLLETTSRRSEECFYTSLEAACVSKLLLIQRMGDVYKKELQELQELYDRNVPDVQKPLDALLDEHPDLFI